MSFGDTIAVNMVIPDLPQNDELSPEKQNEAFCPDLASFALSGLGESSIRCVLEPDPVGRDVSLE